MLGHVRTRDDKDEDDPALGGPHTTNVSGDIITLVPLDYLYVDIIT